MQTKARYTQEPEPVISCGRHNGYVSITVACNATHVSDGQQDYWEADTNTFWELEDAINIDDVLADPQAYLDYITTSERDKAINAVQEWHDSHMGMTAHVPCSLGWNVEYTPSSMQLAQGIIIMMIRNMMQTASWTDAEHVRHNGLTIEDMEAVAASIANHVQNIQDKSDDAKEAIRKATTMKEIRTILSTL